MLRGNGIEADRAHQLAARAQHDGQADGRRCLGRCVVIEVALQIVDATQIPARVFHDNRVGQIGIPGGRVAGFQLAESHQWMG